jgi:hypothetical protein
MVSNPGRGWLFHQIEFLSVEWQKLASDVRGVSPAF